MTKLPQVLRGFFLKIQQIKHLFKAWIRDLRIVTFGLVGVAALALHVRGPERQIVTQQLHDQRRVLGVRSRE